jgi:hypothetical protein
VFSGNDSRGEVYDKHGIRKQFQYVDTYIKPTTDALTIIPYYAIDLMDSAQVRTSGNYTALSTEAVAGWDGTGVKYKRIRLFGVGGKTLALKWYHNTVAQAYVFEPSVLDYQWKSKTVIT